MNALSALIQALHGVAASAWIGGIFFAYMALRPAANGSLEPPQRLRLWHAVYGRFFPWVWVFIGTLLITGYSDLFLRFNGFDNGAVYLIMMHLIGLIMIAFFCYLYFMLYRSLGLALKQDDIAGAADVMKKVRPVMATNLGLGILIIAVGVAGPYF